MVLRIYAIPVNDFQFADLSLKNRVENFHVYQGNKSSNNLVDDTDRKARPFQVLLQ